MRLRSQEELGKFIEKRMVELGCKKNTDLAERYANAKGENYTKDDTKGIVGKWIDGKAYPGADNLFYLAQALEVSADELLDAEYVKNEDGDDRKFTLYSVARSDDETIWEEFLKQTSGEDMHFMYLNCDEFGKNLLDYMIEFGNFDLLEVLKKKHIVGVRWDYEDGMLKFDSDDGMLCPKVMSMYELINKTLDSNDDEVAIRNMKLLQLDNPIVRFDRPDYDIPVGQNYFNICLDSFYYRLMKRDKIVRYLFSVCELPYIDWWIGNMKAVKSLKSIVRSDNKDSKILSNNSNIRARLIPQMILRIWYENFDNRYWEFANDTEKKVIFELLDIALETNEKVYDYLTEFGVPMENFCIEQNGNVVCLDSRVENGDIASISSFIVFPEYNLRWLKDCELKQKLMRLQIGGGYISNDENDIESKLLGWDLYGYDADDPDWVEYCQDH